MLDATGESDKRVTAIAGQRGPVLFCLGTRQACLHEENKFKHQLVGPSVAGLGIKLAGIQST